MVYKKFNKSSPRIICPNQPRCENRSVLYSEFESEVIIALKKYINDFKIKISNGDNQSESIQTAFSKV